MQEDAELGAHEYAEPALGLGYWHGLCASCMDLFGSMAGRKGTKFKDQELLI